MDALVLIPRGTFEAVAGEHPQLGDVHWFEPPPGLPASFARLFMVTVRPDGALWLVHTVAKDVRAKTWNGANTWTVDLSPVLEHLQGTNGVPRPELALALRETRPLSQHDGMLLTHACDEGLLRRSRACVAACR